MCCRSVQLPGFHRELQPGRRGPLQVHPGGVQDRADEGGGAHLPREQLLQPGARQELSQGTAETCSQSGSSGWHWELIMGIHIGGVFTYPSCVLYTLCPNRTRQMISI